LVKDALCPYCPALHQKLKRADKKLIALQVKVKEQAF